MIEISLIEAFFLPILALLIGVVSAMLGIGGGVFIVPALQLLPPSITGVFTPQLAAGTSLTIIFFKSLSSASRYAVQKRIDYKIGLLMAVTSIPGAYIGATLTNFIEKEVLTFIFACFLLYVAIRMLLSFKKNYVISNENGWNRHLIDSEGDVFKYSANVKLGLPLAFFAGFSSGLLGIGGGSLMVPILHFTLSFPIHIAIATSCFIMIFTTTSGFITHISLGNVKFDYILILSIGIIVGAQIGAYLCKRFSDKILRKTFGSLLIIISFRMFMKLFGNT